MSHTNVFRAAGALGARRRWQPGSSDEELLADLEAARLDDKLDGVVASAGSMTPEQIERMRLFFNSLAPAR